MIHIAGSVAKSWLARRLGVKFDREYYFDLQRRQELDRACNEYVRAALGDLPVFYTESNLGRYEHFTHDQVLVGGIQPNMIIGMLLGADFIPVADADADISARCLENRDPEELPDPSTLLAHPLIRLWDAQILDLWSGKLPGARPIPPFFWDDSGRAAVHGPVTSGLKFYGDRFLLDLLGDPDRSQRVITWLVAVTCALVDHYALVGRMPVQGIHVGECVACMLDEPSFRRFIVPVASELGNRYRPLRFHSCGRSDHVIEACRQIEGLGSLDVGGETSVAVIRRVFGRAFPVGIAPLVDHLRAATTHEILAWYRQVAEDNDGGDLTIGFHLEADYNEDTIRALHRAVLA